MTKRDWWDKEFQKLVTLGESTTAGGWSSCRERCWPSRLADLINEFQRVPVQLINAGIGANLISNKSPGYEFSGKPAANERLDRHVLAYKPDLLVIAYGLNDARVGTPLEMFLDEMRWIVRRVREDIQPLIVLPGPFYVSKWDYNDPRWEHGNLELFHVFNRVIEEVAAQLDCLYVDVLSAYHNADWLMHFDGVHANDLGHRLVANKIFEILASSCSGLALETRALEKFIPPWRDESTLRMDYGHK